LERYMDNRGDDIDISTVYRGLSSINRNLCDADDMP
jgi:RNA polymerase sporulation-specific sigma factor